MSSFYHFPSDFYWTTSVKNHDKIKNIILPQIEQDIKTLEKKPDWCCDAISSFCYRKDFLYNYLLLDDAIWKPIKEMFDNFPNNYWQIKLPKGASISKIWYNYYDGIKSTHQEQHHHRPHNFSGIYFLELNSENTTTFYNYHPDVSFERRKVLDDVKEGDVVIFPSSLMHQVNYCYGKKISISFNVNLFYSEEEKSHQNYLL